MFRSHFNGLALFRLSPPAYRCIAELAGIGECEEAHACRSSFSSGRKSRVLAPIRLCRCPWNVPNAMKCSQTTGWFVSWYTWRDLIRRGRTAIVNPIRSWRCVAVIRCLGTPNDGSNSTNCLSLSLSKDFGPSGRFLWGARSPPSKVTPRRPMTQVGLSRAYWTRSAT